MWKLGFVDIEGCHLSGPTRPPGYLHPQRQDDPMKEPDKEKDVTMRHPEDRHRTQSGENPRQFPDSHHQTAVNRPVENEPGVLFKINQIPPVPANGRHVTVGTNSKDKLADLGADELAVDAGKREPDTEEDGFHDAALLLHVLRGPKHADHGVGRVLEGALEEGDDEDDGDAHEEEGAKNRPVELVEKEEVGLAPHRYSLFHRVEGFRVSKCCGRASALNISDCAQTI